MAYYLSMDGVDDYIRTPSMTFDKVIIDFSYEFRSGVWQYFIDARTGIASRLLSINTDTLYSGQASWTSMKVDGVAISNPSQIPKNQRTILELVGTLGADDVNIFSTYTGGSPLKGDIYDIKFYNGATLVAHYDMSTQTVQDQSGNGNHATLTGGTWVDDGTGGGEPVGTDVSYSYSMKQAIYADRITQAQTAQKLYADRQNQYPIKQAFYADRVSSYALKQAIYAQRSWNYPMIQQIFSDYKLYSADFPLQQVLYADRETSFQAVQRMYKDVSYSYPLAQSFYTSIWRTHQKPVTSWQTKEKPTTTWR